MHGKNKQFVQQEVLVWGHPHDRLVVRLRLGKKGGYVVSRKWETASRFHGDNGTVGCCTLADQAFSQDRLSQWSVLLPGIYEETYSGKGGYLAALARYNDLVAESAQREVAA